MKNSKLFKTAFTALLFLVINIGQAQIYEGISATASQTLINDNIDNPNFVILDVRTPGEHNPQHLEGAILRNFYDSDFSDQLDLLDKDKKYLIHCKSGGRSGITLGTMENLGFAEVYDMLGGMNSWNSNSLPTTDAFAPRIMFVSDNNFPLEVITIGETETIPVTITNRANSTLNFLSVTSLDGTEFESDFDLSTELLGAEDYTFNIMYSPVDETEDALTFTIESNDGAVEVMISRNGEMVVGTAQIDNKIEMEIYPNPTSGILQFKGLTSSEKTIEVINANGQILLRKQLKGFDGTINVSTVEKGIYIVKIVEDEIIFAKKVVID